jgi:hypothetical protein
MEEKDLRKETIKTQICGLLNGLKDHEIKRQISQFFLKDVFNYIGAIITLAPHLSKEGDYSLELESKLEHLNYQILLKGFCLEELVSEKSIMQLVKDNFRKLIGTWVYKGIIVKRAFEKPRGYPGDYKMLEIVYDNKPISKNIGMYFDNNFLKSPYATALRIRKDRLRALLQNYINEAKSTKIQILNIASGSCREIRELLPSLKTQNSITFTCLDWDEEALNFSKDALSKGRKKNIVFKFVKEDIMDIIRNKGPLQLYNKQNLIYSIGLIDYLPDRVLRKLIVALFQLLQEGGKLILTHKNREKTFPPIHPDWFCDWRFVSRNKDEIVKLFYNCGLSRFSVSIESDDFGYIYYFSLTKI